MGEALGKAVGLTWLGMARPCWWMAAAGGNGSSTCAGRGKDKSAQSRMVNSKIPEPASLRKDAARRHIIDRVPVRLGKRYGGNSKISGMRRPLTAVRPS